MPELKEISPKLWDRIVGEFRRYPGRYKQVAIKIGCTHAQAESFWHKGIPNHFEPIKETVARLGKLQTLEIPPANLPVSPDPPTEDKHTPQPTPATTTNVQTPTTPKPAPESPPNAIAAPQASVSLDPVASVNEALASIRRDLAKALPREAQVVSNQRERAMAASNISTMLLQGAQARARQLMRHMLKKADEGDLKSTTLVIKEINAAVRIAREVDAAVKASQESTRLLVGLPQSITANIDASTPSTPAAGASLDDLVTKLEDMRRRTDRVIDVEATPAPTYRGEEQGA